MPRKKDPEKLARQIADADARGNMYLADANKLMELGHTEQAEALYEKGQFWLDRSNKLRGNR